MTLAEGLIVLLIGVGILLLGLDALAQVAMHRRILRLLEELNEGHGDAKKHLEVKP